MKKSKFLYMVPTILICLMLSLFPLFNYLTEIKKVNSPYMGIFGIAYLLILILLILWSMYQLVSLIRFVIQSDWIPFRKAIWIILLVLFNILMIPYFYSRFINKDKRILLRSLIYLIPVILFAVFAFCTMDVYNKELKRIEDEKKAIEAERHYYSTKDGVVSFTFRHGYVDKTNNPESGEYDIYVQNEEENVVMHGFTYETEKYVEQTPDEFLNKAINEMATSKLDFNLVKDREEVAIDDKVITSITYEGKTESSSLCVYKISIISFNNKPGYLVYVVEIVTKSKYKDKLPILDEILQSAKLN
ncbi:MAG: hypothetical protein IKF36_03000 [Bacilli bacterium]|nr:hypothetical protein [Bacilli bacterium]